MVLQIQSMTQTTGVRILSTPPNMLWEGTYLSQFPCIFVLLLRFNILFARRDGCLTARPSTRPAERRHTASNKLQVTPWVHAIKPSEFPHLSKFNCNWIPSKLLPNWIVPTSLFSFVTLCPVATHQSLSCLKQSRLLLDELTLDCQSFRLNQKFPPSKPTLLWPFPFQEYFYKSQESLATVIDFVEEKVEKTRKDGNEDKKEEMKEESPNTSTHSSPLFPASRKRPKNLDPRRRLTPWRTGLEVWSL